MIKYLANNLTYIEESEYGCFVLLSDVEDLQEQYENELRDKDALIVELSGKRPCLHCSHYGNAVYCTSCRHASSHPNNFNGK